MDPMQRIERIQRLVEASPSRETMTFLDILEGTLNTLANTKKRGDEKVLAIARRMKPLDDSDAEAVLEIIEAQVLTS